MSVGFFRQEYQSGSTLPPLEELHNPGVKPMSPLWQVDSLPTEPSGKPDRCHGESNKPKVPCLGCKCSHLGMNHFQGLACPSYSYRKNRSLYVRDRILLGRVLQMNGAGRKGEGMLKCVSSWEIIKRNKTSQKILKNTAVSEVISLQHLLYGQREGRFKKSSVNQTNSGNTYTFQILV